MVPGPEASGSDGNVVGMQVLEPHPRPTEPDTLQVGPSSPPLTSPPVDFHARSSLTTTALYNTQFLFGIRHTLKLRNSSFVL